MSTQAFDGSCACSCGTVKLRAKRPAMLRFFCHCGICQKVYNKPFADVTVLRAKDVEIENLNLTEFKRHRPPPNLNRGNCSSCHEPTIGLMTLAPGLKLTFVPTHMFNNMVDVPASSMHMFYDNRVADADDDLPKHMGYLKSELAISAAVMSGLFKR